MTLFIDLKDKMEDETQSIKESNGLIDIAEQLKNIDKGINIIGVKLNNVNDTLETIYNNQS